MSQRYLVILAMAFIAGCGGGGGGASDPPQDPTLTISGVKASYWQDEAIEISFSVSNMDRETTNFSIAGLNEGFDFTLDATAGKLRTVSDQYTDAGEYSYSVTATDGSGKTASRSFQFRVDAVVIGSSYIVHADGIRGLNIVRSRDGLTGLFFASVELGEDRDRFLLNNLICFGQTDAVGSLVSGTLNCGGKYPASISRDGLASNFSNIASIEIEADVNEDSGVLVFLGSDGSEVEFWQNSISAAEPFEDFDGWLKNTELQGRYLPRLVGHQYTATYLFSSEFSGFSNADIFLTDFRSNPQLIVGPDYKISTEISEDNSSACVINGEISQLSLDEYDLVYGDKGYEWRFVQRQVSGELDATNCSNLGSDGRGKTIDQPPGPFLATVVDNVNPDGNTVVELVFFGSGIDRPFIFTAIKICNSDGSPTAINTEAYKLSCE